MPIFRISSEPRHLESAGGYIFSYLSYHMD